MVINTINEKDNGGNNKEFNDNGLNDDNYDWWCTWWWYWAWW